MNQPERDKLRRDRAKMHKYAQTITTQAQLNSILLEIKTPHARGICFEMIKPMLRFKAEYPGHVACFDETMNDRSLAGEMYFGSHE